MRSLLVAICMLGLSAGNASSQSLFILQGERAAEGSVGWSVGPFSNGWEMHGALSLDGRWDVGFGINRYGVDLGGEDDSVFTEWTPFVRYFVFKEDDDGTPVSLAAHAQYSSDNFDGDDGGWYLLAGGQLFRKLPLVEGFSLYPFLGFALAGESYTFNASTERAVYLTRQFGVHGQVNVSDDAWIRITVEEQSFRRETYRALRAAFVKRF